MAQTPSTITLVPLDKAVAATPAEHVLKPGLEAYPNAALVGGEYPARVLITGALGERTVVVELEDGSRGVARIPHLLVDPAAVTWTPVRRPKSSRWLGAEPDEQVAEELAEQRRASDQRAQQDQRRLHRQVDAERRPPRTGPSARSSSQRGGGDGDEIHDRAGADVETDRTSTRRVGHDSVSPPMPARSPRRGEESAELETATDPILSARTATTSGAGRRAAKGRSGHHDEQTGDQVDQHPQDDGGDKAHDAAGATRPDPPPEATSPEPALALPEAGGVEADAAAGMAPGSAEDLVDPVDGPDAAHDAQQPVVGAAPADLTRRCERCDGQLRRNNSAGVCTGCRTTCPGCGGQKAIAADRCFDCRMKLRAAQRGAPIGVASLSTGTVDAAGDGDSERGSGRDEATAEALPGEDRGADSIRTCERCGRQLPGQNRKGVCTPCQAVCPACDGPKAPDAERCRACSKKAQLRLADEALTLAGSLTTLPGQLRELIDSHATLARYAKALEDELEGYRAAERSMHRIGREAIAAAGGRS